MVPRCNNYHHLPHVCSLDIAAEMTDIAVVQQLHGLFQDVDPEVIQLVLDSTGGNVDAAVTDLLNISSKPDTEPSQQNSPEIQTPHVFKDISQPPQHFKTFENLPDDFLRPPSYFCLVSLYSHFF